MKRAVSFLLVFALVVSIVPHAAFAVGGGAPKACSGCELATVNGLDACTKGGLLHVCENNFPDKGFRDYIASNLAVGDTVDPTPVTSMYPSYKSAEDLTGIGYFENLTTLYCYGNKLTELDLSCNLKIETLSVEDNKLTALDVSMLPVLRSLSCGNNMLSSLDVSANRALSTLSCAKNSLTSLDLRKNTRLTRLTCGNNQLTSLDLKNNKALTYLSCAGNSFTSIDLRSNPNLATIDAGDITVLKYERQDHSYEIIPVIDPFCYAVYVKTDDPDPTSFYFVDNDNSLAENGKASFKLAERIFADVVYEDEECYRVPGGYIFIYSNYYSDGGDLTLMVKENGSFVDSGRTVSCPPLKNNVGYVAENYANVSGNVFAKMDAAENSLSAVSVYPNSFEDDSKPNEASKYPYYANPGHIDQKVLFKSYYPYETYKGGLLMYFAYPFVLDSLGFPSVLSSTAKAVDPDCTVKWNDYYHYLVDVTRDGTTRSYGGDGNGGREPVYISHVDYFYDFGSGSALPGLSECYDKLMGLKALAVQDARRIEEEQEAVSLDKLIGGGTWIRTVNSYAYAAYFAGSYRYIYNAWVDGRYTGDYLSPVLGEKFEDHPNAGIVVKDMEYTDRNGKYHKNDVLFSYNSSTDTWSAPFYYADSNSYSSSMLNDMPEIFTLTRAQVEAMQVDRNTNHIPEDGIIYDGTVYPGTPFHNKLVKGISMPETYVVYVHGPSVTFPVTITPSDAAEQRINWTSSDSSIANITYSGYLYGYKEGKATITGETVDGKYTASCEVTVLSRPYIITYDANGGEGAPQPQEKEYGVKITLSEVVPTRAGYNFLGWSKGSLATTASYRAGSSYTQNADIYLYAVWEEQCAKGHSWDVPVYTWSDDHSTATATVVCKRDPGHTLTETVETTKYVYYEPTCTSSGYERYEAQFADSAFSIQYKYYTPPALGHSWSVKEWQWSDDMKSVWAVFACGRCGSEKSFFASVTDDGYACTAQVKGPDGNTYSDVKVYRQVIKGDVNGNGYVTADDLTALSRHVAQIELLTGNALKAADVNGDGQVTADDLTRLSRFVAQIITEL